jgi:N-acetylmuramoyl-L-alanine amidase
VSFPVRALGPCIAVAATLFVASAWSDEVPDRFDTVVLDAGHGGDDHGARGSRGLLEKDVVLDVAKRVASRLRDRGLSVVMTRSDDRFVGLEERTAIANDARGDLFVSIHANAAEDRSAHGIEVYFHSLDASDEGARRVAFRENSAFGDAGLSALVTEDPVVGILGDLAANEQLSESSAFARMAQGRLASLGAGRSRGVKQAPFVVLYGAQMPGTLVEIGFLTHRGDESALRGEERRRAIASALAAAVLEYGRRHDARRGIAHRGAEAP